MRKKGKLVIWPAYLDTDNTWREGRRLSKRLSLRGVRAEEIYEAAEEMGLNPELNPQAGYSKSPWKRTGSVLVDKKGSKSETLKELARRIRSNRTSN
ncbi:MAG: signal recognition particle protein Srp19 [Candidatus Bathyarchaeota archaeon]|nr:MAG: signal recognition particle protein Srp19 [Candidatus Bathyarchaeota archaeon]